MHILAATDYPLLNVFLSMLWFFLFVVWIYLIFTVIVDIFRSADLSGFSKALWVLFVILLPYLGVFVYLIARGSKMHERAMAQAAQQEKAFRSYVQEAAGGTGTSTADELTKLAALRDQGTISAAEFEAQKAKLLS